MKKTVLVTGAASGIGLTCTKLLLERGAKVTAFDPQLEKMVDRSWFFRQLAHNRR